MLVVQETLGQLFSPETRFATIFYQRLFSLAPEIQKLFRGNIETQGEMLGHMIQAVVYAASRPENLALGLQALGRQHVRYGVEAEHYLLVRQALLETIPEVLGDTYSPHVGKAWESIIDSVLGLMSGRT